MDRRKNNKAEDMYRDYLSGLSLSEVGRKHSKTRQSVYSLFKSRGWKCRPKRKPLPFVLYNGEKYTLRNNGYYGKTRGDRRLIHRDVWENERGKIPLGYDIHHIDGDKSNNHVSNLECLSKSEHTRLYSPHNNQYTKGRKEDEL